MSDDDFISSLIFNYGIANNSNKFEFQIYNRKYSCKYDEDSMRQMGMLKLYSGELMVYPDIYAARCMN